jgi:hypothetical protein
MLLFVFTGIMINTYLNPTPLQPRERDYAYVGSYWTYCIWIGLGVLAIWEFLRKNMKSGGIAPAAIAVLLGGTVPLLMGSANWDDHDRSDRYMARDIAANYLESCPPNAILFTQGDNDTYPLWYAQEVEGIRTDVRTVNLSLLGVDWYIDFLQRAVNDGGRVPLSLTQDKYIGDTRNAIQFFDKGGLDQEQYYDLKTVVNMMSSDSRDDQLPTRGGTFVNYLPVKKFGVPVDKQAVLDAGIVPPEAASLIQPVIKFDISKNSIYKPDLLMMDMLANLDWSRPLCFATSVSQSNYMGLGDYFRQEGMVYRLTPMRDPKNDGLPGGLSTDMMYETITQKFRWVDPNTKDIYLNDDNLRNIMNLRNSIVRLASALVQEGKKEQAVEVMDLCVNGIPEKFAPYYGPYSMIMVRFVDLYYRADAKERAREIIEILKGYYGPEIRYFESLSTKDKQIYTEEAQRSNYLYREILRYATTYDDKEYADGLTQEFEEIAQQ